MTVDILITPSDPRDLGDEIRQRRIARLWTITEAATAAGIHPAVWSRVERGASPSVRTLRKILGVLSGELWVEWR